MALKCAICGSEKNVDVVCHHCGRPLCEDAKCRYLLLQDRAFVTQPNLLKRLILFFQQRTRGQKATTWVVAVHCRSCWRQSHWWFQRSLSQEQLIKKMTVGPEKLPARRLPVWLTRLF